MIFGVKEMVKRAAQFDSELCMVNTVILFVIYTEH